jgi:hypothetical protein
MFGRLTFPNSRTASPVVDARAGDHPRHHQRLGRPRCGGRSVSTPSTRSTGQLGLVAAPWRPSAGQHLLQSLARLLGRQAACSYSAGGDSSILAINARTGEPLWRVPLRQGRRQGWHQRCARSLAQDNLVALHESENLDSSEIGRMAALPHPRAGRGAAHQRHSPRTSSRAEGLRAVAQRHRLAAPAPRSWSATCSTR